MAFVFDGGPLYKIPDNDLTFIVTEPAQIAGAWFGDIALMEQTYLANVPDGVPLWPALVSDTNYNAVDICSIKLYRRVLPPLPAPQIPELVETQDMLIFQRTSPASVYHDGTYPYPYKGYDCGCDLRVLLKRFGEAPVVLAFTNSFAITIIQEWGIWGEYVGDGYSLANFGCFYQSGLLPDGTVDPDNDEVLGILATSVYAAMKTTGLGPWQTEQSRGVYVNLTKLGYSINPINTDEEPYVDPEEEDDGYSGTGGGNGDHDKSSDVIGIPVDPTISATMCGFVTLYNPSLAQIQALAAQLQSETFWDTLKNFFEHPQDYIAGLAIIPVQPSVGTAVHPKIGWHDLDVLMAPITDQYVTVDCGALDVNEFYGSSFDYSPMTKIQIFLPYIGYRDLDVDEVMGRRINVIYKVDVYNGNCIAFILVNSSILAQYNGNCMQQIPVSAITFDDVIRNSIMLVGAAAKDVALLAGSGGNGNPQKQKDDEGEYQQATNDLGSSLLSVMSAKPSISRSGSLGSSLGLMGKQKPHLIKHIPKQSLPKQYSKICGYPSNITAKLSELIGYVQIDSIQLSGITGTEQEQTEIISLLNGGVII